jgi:maltokinase
MGEEWLVPEELPRALVDVLGAYLARQRWYAGQGQPAQVAVAGSARVASGVPAQGRLLWAVVEAGASRYQVLVAERPSAEAAERLRGHDEALMGSDGRLTWYDAVVDSEMAVAFLRAASGGEQDAHRARPLTVEQSNTSVVFDDRLILKLFRRLSGGANPDVEVTTALAETGFAHVAAPLVRWQRDGTDLAFGQQFLAGGTDGWALALTSLRDLYGSCSSGGPCEPAASGGDFAAEATRLGQVTADMHIAMAEAYGTSDSLAGEWEEFVTALERQAGELAPDLAVDGHPLFQRLQEVAAVGPSVRVHGDYHLGQVMRTDTGWYVLDFEGEPNRPLEQRLVPTSVFKDVSGMLRSLRYAPQFALRERAEGELAVLEPPARAWQDRNCQAFLLGYYERDGIGELLPSPPEDREAVRVAFELDKAMYELGYERAYRPDWASIPEAALARLLSEPVEVLTALPGRLEGDPGDDEAADVEETDH